jgi:uncharacterized protein (DUF1330 family)
MRHRPPAPARRLDRSFLGRVGPVTWLAGNFFCHRQPLRRCNGRLCLDRFRHVVFVCREILDQEEFIIYQERVNGTLASHPAQVLIDHGRFLILEGEGPVQGVTVYQFPSRDAARSWYDSEAYRAVRQHRNKGAKYLVILAESGVPPVEQRMPHTRVAG